MTKKSTHWADITAEKIIREKGDKKIYSLATGITPSGRVHFGNFREAITVNLVSRALQDLGKEVRTFHSWDDFDTFRKVPKDIEDQDKFEKFLFQPIVDVPDPKGQEDSYAKSFEVHFERELEQVGFDVEYLYQAKKYRAGEYKDDMIAALDNADKIREILNKYRSTPLSEDWLPISAYCPKNLTDQMESLSWDSSSSCLSYTHESGYQGTLDLNNPEELAYVKLPWRIDWPMRWAKEDVDFEPGGKDHSSDGGSFTTAQEIVREVYKTEPPIYLQYDFVSIKGGPGKMSSSKGGVVTVSDVLKIYEPEMIRWIFASYKPNVDFSIGFDEDVIKTYEQFDRQERLAFGLEPGNEKKIDLAKRVYKLAQLDNEIPETPPFQPSFRHLTTLVQIYDGDIDKLREQYASEIKNERDERRFRQRAECAKNWLELYAPDEFVFKVNKEKIELSMSEEQQDFIQSLGKLINERWDEVLDDKDLHNAIYECIHEHEQEPTEAFKLIYQHLISRDKGPRLASFIHTIGKESAAKLL